MTRIALLLVLVACPPRQTTPRPASEAPLITYCSSSAECSHDSNGCTYCFNARCSCTLPAEPTPGGSTSKGTVP